MEWISLIITTFCAATLQAATGFGFGLVAVTMFVILLQTTSVVQIVIIITLVISVFHWFKIKKLAPGRLVIKIMMGCGAGYPIGILIFSYFDLYALKLIVALLIIVTCFHNIWEVIKCRGGYAVNYLPMTNKYFASAGVASGILASSLAMPGPPVIAYLTRCEIDKNAIRATVITCSMFSYAIALLLQMTVVGIEFETIKLSALLVPVALLGTWFGDCVARFINPSLFNNLVLLVLLFSGFNIILTL